MGGLGSGQWYRWNSKSTVEGTRYLDAGEMRRKGVIVPGARSAGTWYWCDAHTGAERSSLGYSCEAHDEGGKLRLFYTIGSYGESRAMDYTVELVTVPSNLGRGVLWYFVCPADRCGRRVKRLYSGRWIYACRHCYDLVHTSTRESHQARRFAAQLAPQLGADPALVEYWLRQQSSGDRALYGAVASISRCSKREQKLLRWLGLG